MIKKREKIFERYTITQILSMNFDELNSRIFINEPIVIISEKNEHVQILAIFEEEHEGIFIELSQIYDEGDKLVLSLAFWILIDKYAREKKFKYVKYIFYTFNATNIKLKNILEKRGFKIDYIDGIGEVYYYWYFVDYNCV